MKQHITARQIDELEGKGLENFYREFAGVPLKNFSHKGKVPTEYIQIRETLDDKAIATYVNIGRMLELSGRLISISQVIATNDKKEKTIVWRVIGKNEEWIVREELLDALWEAVKEALNEPTN